MADGFGVEPPMNTDEHRLARIGKAIFASLPDIDRLGGATLRVPFASAASPSDFWKRFQKLSAVAVLCERRISAESEQSGGHRPPLQEF